MGSRSQSDSLGSDVCVLSKCQRPKSAHFVRPWHLKSSQRAFDHSHERVPFLKALALDHGQSWREGPGVSKQWQCSRILKVKSIWVPVPQRQAPRKGFELLGCIWEASRGSTGRLTGEADGKGEVASDGCLTWEVSYNVGRRSPVLMGTLETYGPEFSPPGSESLMDGCSWEKMNFSALVYCQLPLSLSTCRCWKGDMNWYVRKREDWRKWGGCSLMNRKSCFPPLTKSIFTDGRKERCL